MITDKPYQIRLEAFEGPLDLLLHLIEDEKINIYDIPIAKIVTQYLDYLAAVEDVNFAQLGDFLVMLATLLEIKSKFLLPKPENSKNNQLDEGQDPREELTRLLLEYRKYKNSISELREREKTFTEMFSHRRHFRNNYPDYSGIFDSGQEGWISSQPQEELEKREDRFSATVDESLEEISLYDLLEAFRRLLKRRDHINITEIVDEDIPIAKRIDSIMELVEKSGKLEFSALLDLTTGMLGLVGMFLALLELIRLNRVRVRQSQLFGRIYILKNDRQQTLLQNS